MTIDVLPPETENGCRLYVIGDIHGQIRALKSVLSRIETDLVERPTEDFKIIFLGDLIDRGEDSRAVLDLAIRLASSEHTIILRGNHEEMALGALDNPDDLISWRKYGGLETIASFGLDTYDLMRGRKLASLHHDFREQFGPDRRQFLESRPYSFASGSYFFCHAGIRPGLPLSEQAPADLIWIRDDFLLSELRHEKFIIHGHTPVEQIEVKSNRINIDTGAYMTGRLTCLVLQGSSAHVLDSLSGPITSIF